MKIWHCNYIVLNKDCFNLIDFPVWFFLKFNEQIGNVKKYAILLIYCGFTVYTLCCLKNMVWAIWSIRISWKWKQMGITLWAHSFLSSPSPAVFNLCMLFCLFPLCSFKVFRGPMGFKGSERGRLTVLSKTGCRISVVYHLSLVLCVNTAGVAVLMHHHLNPRLLVQCFFLCTQTRKHTHTHHTPWNPRLTEQMLRVSASALSHTQTNVRTMSTGPLLSDNHHTETNQGVLLLKTHPFLTLHITEVSFCQICGGCLAEKKVVSWWESQL